MFRPMYSVPKALLLLGTKLKVADAGLEKSENLSRK